MERYTFLQAIQAQLAEAGWDFKIDSGWTQVDLEIFTDDWSRLRLTTVGEDLHQGRRNFRCKVQGSWSLSAKIMFGAMVALLIFLIGSLAEVIPWLWFAFLALPLAAWFFEDNRQEYQRALVSLVDKAATAQKLIKLDNAPVKQNLKQPA